LNASTVSSQQSKKVKITGIKVKDKLNINFDADMSGVSYLHLESGNAAKKVLNKPQTFSLTDDYANLNFVWRNPLKYEFIWKDSTYADEQREELKNFIKLLGPIFNLPDNAAAQSNSKQMDAAISKAANPRITTPIAKPTNGFKDYGLTKLYIQLMLGQHNLTDQERIEINKFTVKLKALEAGDINYQPKVQDECKNLFNEVDPANVTKPGKDGVADIAEKNAGDWIKALEENTKKRDEIQSNLNDFTIKDELYNSLFQNEVSEYLNKSKDLNTKNVAIVKAFQPIVDKLKNSVMGNFKPFTYGDQSALVNVRRITLDDGQVLQTELAIIEYKMTDNSLALEKVKESEKVKLVFRGYDPVSFSVSTGLFYGSTHIKGFGTTVSGGDMVVTEDTLNKESAVAAIFGNFNFSIRSRLFAPLIQLGVDPTKKHPFFLLGGGFGIPVANFAISGGGIWTTEPKLKTLKPGDKIESTTKLENDIKNDFNLKPKGWYLGLQYNF
jgi:hypothetical protein